MAKKKVEKVRIKLKYDEEREGAFKFEVISKKELPEDLSFESYLGRYRNDWRLIVGRMFASGYKDLAVISEEENPNRDAICWYIKAGLPNGKQFYLQLSHERGEIQTCGIYGTDTKHTKHVNRMILKFDKELRENLPVPFEIEFSDATVGIAEHDGELQMFYKENNRTEPYWDGNVTNWRNM